MRTRGTSKQKRKTVVPLSKVAMTLATKEVDAFEEAICVTMTRARQREIARNNAQCEKTDTQPQKPLIKLNDIPFDPKKFDVQAKIFIETLKKMPMDKIQFYQMPFTKEECKALESRKIIRVPPPYGKLSKSIYLCKKLPIVDNPVHKCSCYEDKNSRVKCGSSTRPNAFFSSSIHKNNKLLKKSKKKKQKIPKEGFCGENCHNRMMFISCMDEICSAPDPNLCHNRSIQRRENKSTRVEYMKGPGFGLVANEAIQAGEFIIEYVGEVIDDEECERRLNRCRELGEKHFYMLEIEKDIVIDARYRSNAARFINHSCDPNGVTQKWNVNGLIRIGIFARRTIQPNEEITIDYKFTHFGEEVECKCQANSCTGKMGRLHPDLVEMMAENGHLLKKDQNTSDFLPNEISRPKAVHSLALLKSAQLEQEWLHTYGFQKRRLFFSHGDSSSDTSFVSSTQTSACASPSPIKECSVSNSSYETTLDSKNTTKTDRNIPIASTNNFSKGTTDTTKCTKLPNGTWYKKFKEGKLDELYPREETFLCGGVSDWTQELKSVRRIALNKSRENQFSFKLKKKRVSLLEARAKRFADIIAFANGKSKWNKRIPSSARIDPERIYRFIHNAKNNQHVQQSDVNDLNEDACFRCGLAGELVCCDGCPAAFHMSCANLTILPPDGTPWFCPECINPRQTESSTRGRNARSRAAPMQPSLKRIFHHEPTKRRAKKKMKKTSDKSEPLLEKLPISTSDEMNENLSDA